MANIVGNFARRPSRVRPPIEARFLPVDSAAPAVDSAAVPRHRHTLNQGLAGLSRGLCQRISKLIGTTINLGVAVSAFAQDNANEFILDKASNKLDLEDFGIELTIASQGAGRGWRTTKHVRWFGPAMRMMPINWAMKVADEGTKAFLRYLQVRY